HPGSFSSDRSGSVVPPENYRRLPYRFGCGCVDSSRGNGWSKKNVGSCGASLPGDGNEVRRAELILVSVGYGPAEVRKYSLPKLKLLSELAREMKLQDAL